MIVKNSEIIFLAMKPQHFFSEKVKWTEDIQDYGLFVSVMAGVPIATLKSTLESVRVKIQSKFVIISLMAEWLKFLSHPIETGNVFIKSCGIIHSLY